MACDACSKLIGFKIFGTVPTNFSLCRGDSVYFADEGTPEQAQTVSVRFGIRIQNARMRNPNEVIKSTIPS